MSKKNPSVIQIQSVVNNHRTKIQMQLSDDPCSNFHARKCKALYMCMCCSAHCLLKSIYLDSHTDIRLKKQDLHTSHLFQKQKDKPLTGKCMESYQSDTLCFHMTFQMLEQHKHAVLHYKFTVSFRLDLMIIFLLMIQAQEKNYTSPLKQIL